MTTNQRQIPQIDCYHDNQLARFKEMAEVSPEIAVTFADEYCAKYHVNRPDWLARKAVELFQHYEDIGSPRPIGRSKGSKQRFCQDMIHFYRWDEVTELRSAQKQARQEHDKLRNYKGKRDITHLLKHQEKMLHWLGHTWLHVYDCASMTLKDTPARGGPETMKASYSRVQEAMKDPTQAKRFCIEEHDIMKALKDEKLMELMQGMKPARLFDLTP